MTEKEKQIQGALGTIKRQIMVAADCGDIETFLDELKKALENFGLFMYYNCNPLDDPGVEAIAISNEKLTDTQVEQFCKLWHGEDN